MGAPCLIRPTNLPNRQIHRPVDLEGKAVTAAGRLDQGAVPVGTPGEKVARPVKAAADIKGKAAVPAAEAIKERAVALHPVGIKEKAQQAALADIKAKALGLAMIGTAHGHAPDVMISLMPSARVKRPQWPWPMLWGGGSA
jgi:hypothetical protein